jgi:hypothetical protein
MKHVVNLEFPKQLEVDFANEAVAKLEEQGIFVPGEFTVHVSVSGSEVFVVVAWETNICPTCNIEIEPGFEQYFTCGAVTHKGACADAHDCSEDDEGDNLCDTSDFD